MDSFLRPAHLSASLRHRPTASPGAGCTRASVLWWRKCMSASSVLGVHYEITRPWPPDWTEAVMCMWLHGSVANCTLDHLEKACLSWICMINPSCAFLTVCVQLPCVPGYLAEPLRHVRLSKKYLGNCLTNWTSVLANFCLCAWWSSHLTLLHGRIANTLMNVCFSAHLLCLQRSASPPPRPPA